VGSIPPAGTIKGTNAPIAGTLQHFDFWNQSARDACAQGFSEPTL